MAKRGRPPGTTKALRNDPDRFAIALFDALSLCGASENKARLLVAGLLFGREVPAPLIPASARNRRRLAQGWGAARYQTRVTVAGKASSILKKAQHATSEDDLALRSVLAAAWRLAIGGQHFAFGVLRDAIRLLCDSIDEPEFGDALLRAMVERAGPVEFLSRSLAERDAVTGPGTPASAMIEAPVIPTNLDIDPARCSAAVTVHP